MLIAGHAPVEGEDENVRRKLRNQFNEVLNLCEPETDEHKCVTDVLTTDPPSTFTRVPVLLNRNS
ncbi:unnamed protein product [Timema podura]|uniref:Uncharacterized protein n=1 Tax=Timema podura TaxID=61482 RepID=A0ABN7P1W5_TIMPD|nr:unnamed protein product [Timema podura]